MHVTAFIATSVHRITLMMNTTSLCRPLINTASGFVSAVEDVTMTTYMINKLTV